MFWWGAPPPGSAYLIFSIYPASLPPKSTPHQNKQTYEIASRNTTANFNSEGVSGESGPRTPFQKSIATLALIELFVISIELELRLQFIGVYVNGTIF